MKKDIRTLLDLGREDFEDLPLFTREGGWARANRVFFGSLQRLITDLNIGVAA